MKVVVTTTTRSTFFVPDGISPEVAKSLIQGEEPDEMETRKEVLEFFENNEDITPSHITIR